MVSVFRSANDRSAFTSSPGSISTASRVVSQPTTKLYNSVNIFKRAQGQGRIRHIEGLEQIKRDFGQWIVHIDLLPVGAPRRNWIQTLLSDGFVTLRHPDLQTAMQMADRVGTDLQLYAG